MKKIAWIGAGVMGQPMAGHLARAGYEVRVYARRGEILALMSRDYGIERGYTSIKEAVEGADAVFVMVGYPQDVEEVMLGPGGVFDSAAPGAYIIDMTTSSPALAARLYELGKARGLRVLDAPVSGGDKGAKNGALAIMAGGEAEDFAAVKPLLEVFGSSVNHMGPAGAGQHTKACNQICVAGATAAYTEALAYAQRVGLDPEKMFAAISGGAAGSWQINNMAPRAMAGDFAPGFYIKHFIKDMGIISHEAQAQDLDLPMLQAVLALYRDLAAQGLENDGTQALIKYYREK